MSFHVPEMFRVKALSSKSDGNNGMFIDRGLKMIASDGAGWEHVSVSTKSGSLPSWSTMCTIKNMFWDEEDWVVQFHPAKSEYVNNYPCLHLWRPSNKEMPTPPSILVGIK
jgi:hypothetical protein